MVAEPVSSDIRPRRFDDVNAVAAGFLRDLAYAQTSEPRMFGYKRAAAAVLALERPLTSLIQPGGALAKVPGVGPASERVIFEVLDGGSIADRGASRGRERPRRRHRAPAGPPGPLPEPRGSVAYSPRRALCGSGVVATTRATCRCTRSGATGVPSLADIVAGCLERGYAYAAVTDHSHGLKIARRHVDGRSRRAARGDRAAQRRLRRPLPPHSRHRSQHRRRRRCSISLPTKPPASSWCSRRRTRSSVAARIRPRACSPP